MGKGAADWALIVLPTIAGSISLLCSLALIWKLRHQLVNNNSNNNSRLNKMVLVKNRILFGLSLSDMVFSAGSMMSTFAGPSYLQEYYSDLFHIIGSTATCRMQGFLYYLGGVCTPFYNASLCFYYYQVVIKGRQQSYSIFNFMHAVIWILGLVMATIPLAMDTYYFVGYQGCFVHDTVEEEDPICEDLPDIPDCTRGDFPARYLILGTFVIPQFIAIALVVIFMGLLFCNVRKVEKRAEKWDVEKTLQSYQNNSVTHSINTALIVSRPMVARPSEAQGSADLAATGVPPTGQEQGKSTSLHLSNDLHDEENTNSTSLANANKVPAAAGSSSTVETASKNTGSERKSSEAAHVSGNHQVESSHTTALASTTTTTLAASSPAAQQSTTTTARQSKNKKKRNSTRISEIGTLYVVAFLVTYVFVWVSIFVADTGTDPTPLQFLSSTLFPLQGFWNWLIYIYHQRQQRQKP